MQKFMCYCTVFALFILNLKEISKYMYKPPGAYNYLEGWLTEGLLHNEIGGLIFGGAYFWNFTVSLLQAHYQAPALANVRPQQPG